MSQTQNFPRLTPAQEKQIIHFLNSMLEDGRYQGILFTVADAEQRFIEALRYGEPVTMPLLAQGYSDLLLLLQVPLHTDR